MNILLLVCLVFIGNLRVIAQSTQPSRRCPVSVEPEARTIDHTNPIVFTARVDDELLRNDLKYQWRVYPGTITAGQGSSKITVDISGLAGHTITANVEVSGLSDPCSTASQIVAIIIDPSPPTVFDRYGDLRFAEEKIRLDAFAKELVDRSDLRGAIHVFAGKRTYRGEAAGRLRRARNYLIRVHRLAPSRIIMLEPGFDNELTMTLWLVPREVSLPFLKSTVPIEEVRFTKRRPAHR